MSSFKFPPFYSFPPSFTKQPVPVTLAKQTSLWCDLIRDYCRFHRIFWIDVTEAASSPLFHNSAIQRKLSFENIEYFLGELVNRGEAEWDEGKNRCLVFWRKPDEWGDMIYQWIDETGRNGTILTLYEIRLSDETRGRGRSDPQSSDVCRESTNPAFLLPFLLAGTGMVKIFMVSISISP